MKIIGITGGIGSGKSTVSSEFKKLGATVVDADNISRMVTAKNGCAYPEIIQAFGEEILLDNGEIDRKKLAKFVFSDKSKLNELNKITHKYVFEEMDRQIANAEAEIVVLDVPLLFNKDFPIKCDLKIAVIADRAIRIERVKNRNGLSTDEVEARIKNQLTDEEYARLADVCIINENLDNTKEQIKKIYESV